MSGVGGEGGTENPDPWFGRQHSDVTQSHHNMVPSHAMQGLDAPVPNFDRCSTDVTDLYHSHPTSPPPENVNYGIVSSDITRHLQAVSPKFTVPRHHEDPYSRFHHQIFPPQISTGHNRTELMHPLGKSRPFPLTQLFYYGGSRPASRNQSPPSRNRSPGTSPKQGRQRALSPRHQSPPRPRSGSPKRSSEFSCHAQTRNQSAPRSASPTIYSTPSRLQAYVPAAFLNCARRCQLCPPCAACQELLEFGYGDPQCTREGGAERQAVHCAGITMGGGGVGGRSHCQFHGTYPCPVQAGLPCYGIRPWSPKSNKS